MDIVISLRTALDIEHKGATAYIDAGNKTKHPLAKRLFYRLAQEEIDHILKIEDIFQSIEGKKPWPDWQPAPAGKIETSIRAFFVQVGRDTASKPLDNVQVLKMAMELEKQSYKIYADMEKSNADERVQRFSKELKKQETEHYEALENIYRFLTGTKDWFQETEGKVWNWMVT
jgi:rubrerythrin